MKKAIKTYYRDFLAIIGLSLIALVVGGVILGHQRFHLPKWVPFVGSDFVDYKAELGTAKSITPGQGQTVNVAGVPVGEISKVDLVDGKAVVTMKIRRKYTPIYKDATALVRPKTGLEDMIIELTPGSRTSGTLPANGKSWIPVAQTLPTVNLDEILASLDGDTRSYLQLLLAGAGEGLKGQGRRLSADFKRLEPTSRDVLKITRKLAERRDNVSRTIHNFSRLSTALAGKDKQLAGLVDSSNAVFKSFANQDAKLRQSLRLLPGTLNATNTNLAKADKLAKQLGPTLGALRPAARALGPSLRQTRPFLQKTTPIVRTQLRPFSRDARPAVRDLRPAANDLAKLAPDLTSSLKVVNYLLNTLAYDKPGDGNESYLFWASWVNHAGNSVFSNADAHGPIRRGLLEIGCSELATLDQLKQVSKPLSTLIGLVDPARTSDVCAQPTGPSQGAIGTPGAAPRQKGAKP